MIQKNVAIGSESLYTKVVPESEHRIGADLVRIFCICCSNLRKVRLVLEHAVSARNGIVILSKILDELTGVHQFHNS